jgi:hypothetical protein
MTIKSPISLKPAQNNREENKYETSTTCFFLSIQLRLLLIHGFAMAGKTMQAFCYDGYGGGAAALKVHTVR